MALTFGALSSDRVNAGTGANLGTLDPFTMIAWVFATTLSATTAILQKGLAGGATAHLLRLGNTAGEVECLVSRATTAANRITNSTPLAINAWRLIAATFDSGASPNIHIYSGSLSAAAAEATYATTNAGSGAVNSDTAQALLIGNSINTNVAFIGRIAVVAYIARALTLGEIIDWQFRPRVIANTRGFWIPGYNGTTNVPDLSGNGNVGTITGATIADHVPLPHPFGRDDGWAPYIIATGGGNVTVTPGAIAMSLSAAAPTPAIQVLPGVLAAALSAPAPTPAIRTLPGVVAMTSSLLAPTPLLQALPGAVVTTLSAPAPTPAIQVLPGAVSASLSVLSLTPVLQATPGAVALALSTLAATPGIGANPSAVALLLAALAPTIIGPGGVTVSPSTVALALGALAPTPSIQVAPGTVALALLALGATPTIKATPGAVALLLAALAPTVTGPGGVSVTPGAVALVLQALAVTPLIKAQPSTVALVLQALAIVVGQMAARALPTDRGQAVAGPTNRGQATATPTDRSY